MQTYDVSYAEALHLIDDVVADIKKALAAEGEYVLNGIGVLSTTLSGTLSFTPNEAGVVAPDFYGLRSLSIKKRVKSSADKGARSDFGATAQEGRKKNNTYTFRINRELCNYAAAVIVAVFFYFLWATCRGYELTTVQSLLSVWVCYADSGGVFRNGKRSEYLYIRSGKGRGEGGYAE